VKSNRYNFQIFKGDITTFQGDVIVNTANTFLIPEGGVNGAIHRATESKLYDELKHYGLLAIFKTSFLLQYMGI
jgi:O-acetyl-ADP-ribose deacetylase (regulator of RNase III)